MVDILTELYADSNLVSSQTQQLTSAALNNYEDVQVQVVVPQDGYVSAYVGNESNADVFFDDVSVEHRQGLQVQENQYDPWGLSLAGLDYASPSVKGLNQYQFNGKERQNDLGLNLLDYGARLYDAQLGRWPTMDGKAELYLNWSPYTYALNTPTNAIDPDGRLVIFIAGQNPSNGASAAYWQENVTYGYSSHYTFDGMSGGHLAYSALTRPVAVDQLILNQFHDTSTPLYRDGALGGWDNTISNHTPDFYSGYGFVSPKYGMNNLSWRDRKTAGYQRGQAEAGDIIASLKRSGGVITESLKIVAHSMGAAYAKGYIQAFVEWAKQHPKLCEGLSITEYDFAAFQQNHLSAVEGVPLFQYDNMGDDVVGGFNGMLNGSKHQKEQRATSNNVNQDGGHSMVYFLNVISSLPQGNYIFQNGQFIKQ